VGRVRPTSAATYTSIAALSTDTIES